MIHNAWTSLEVPPNTPRPHFRSSKRRTKVVQSDEDIFSGSTKVILGCRSGVALDLDGHLKLLNLLLHKKCVEQISYDSCEVHAHMFALCGCMKRQYYRTGKSVWSSNESGLGNTRFNLLRLSCLMISGTACCSYSHRKSIPGDPAQKSYALVPVTTS